MVGIAIINYRTYEKTIECVDSIRKTLRIPYRIYLLENGSGNESEEILTDKYQNSEDVVLLVEKKNHGYAQGNNLCILHMRADGCEIGIISNNDIICTSNSIQVLVEDLHKHSDFLLVGPQILSPAGEFQKSVKVKPYTEIEYLERSTYLSRFFKKKCKEESEDIKAIKSFISVSWVSGAFFAVNLQKFSDIGDFDPNTFLFFEEYILSTKAKKMGYKLGYDPNSIVYHYHSYSTGGWRNVITKIEADRSERYYIERYSCFSNKFLCILKFIRMLEAVLTFGKKKDWKSIQRYFREVKKPLI